MLVKRYGGAHREVSAILGGLVIRTFLAVFATFLMCAETLARAEAAPEPIRSTSLSYEGAPISFEPNEGQLDDSVRFSTRAMGYSLFLRRTDAVIDLHKTTGPSSDVSASGKSPCNTCRSTLRMELVNSSPVTEITGLDELSSKVNYFVGNDRSRWRANVPTYSKVKYKDVYPGIDLIYYGSHGRLECDFIVSPLADPRAIILRFHGREPISVADDGSLRIGNHGLSLEKPVVFQNIDGRKKVIDAHYEIGPNHSIRLALRKYDPKEAVVIDPVFEYSTYLGGSLQDIGHGVAVDESGNAYVVGQAFSLDFPTVNALQANNAAAGGVEPANVFITKFDPHGSKQIYSTYLGGGERDAGAGIAVDSQGNVYVTGRTTSGDFPNLNALIKDFRGCCGVNSTTGFVAKLNANGSALIYSTFLGGFGEDFANAIAADSQGNAYITGTTSSPFDGCGLDECKFPTTRNALQPKIGGPDETRNAFVSKINPDGSAFVFSTYLGGNADDEGQGIAVDNAGNVYVIGNASSKDFPTANAFQAILKGSATAFVSKIKADGTAFVYSTFLGGTQSETTGGIAVDAFGNAYVTGQTFSSDFPVVHAFQSSLHGEGDVFVSKFDPAGKSLVYSTYLGGTGFDGAASIAVDRFGNAFIAGSSDSKDFPVLNPLQSKFGGGFSDAFVSEFNSDGTQLVYSTFLGGSGDDFATSIAVNGKGRILVTGGTNSSDFPTDHPLQPGLGAVGAINAFVTKIVPDHPSYVHALSDLYTARNHLTSINNHVAMREIANAVQEIDKAISDVRLSIVEDDKDPHEHPPVDAGADRTDALHRTEILLQRAHLDISSEEDNGFAQQLQHDALDHVAKAIQNVRTAIEAIDSHK